LYQRPALDDEIRVLQRDCGGATIGEKFKPANLVDDTPFGGAAKQTAHALGYDQGASGRFKRLAALENPHWNALFSQQAGSKKTGSRAANYGDVPFVSSMFHSEAGVGIRLLFALFRRHILRNRAIFYVDSIGLSLDIVISCRSDA
jgi:hypothetical protein